MKVGILGRVCALTSTTSTPSQHGPDQLRTRQFREGVTIPLPWKLIGGGAALRPAGATLPSGPGAALWTANFRPSEAPAPADGAWGALRAELFAQSR